MDIQREMMASLGLMLFQRQRQNRSQLELYNENSQILSILDWIATCFVTDSTGDAVSTAFFAKKGHITFYIATNRGQPREQDRENGEKFKQLIRGTIGQTDTFQIMVQFLEAITPIIYLRFTRKMDKIAKIDKHGENQLPVQDRFDKIVDRWAKGNNMEDNAFLLHVSVHLGADETKNGNERLKYLFKVITLATTDSGLPHAEREKSPVRTFAFAASALVASKFITSFDKLEPGNPIPRFDEDFLWILRLRRRLLRIARYRIGAFTFAQNGLLYIKRVLGEEGTAAFQKGGAGIEIIWIGDQPGVLPDGHGCDVEMSRSPEDFLDEQFTKFDYVDSKKQRPAIPQETKADLGKLWHTPGSIKPYLHCELQMIMFLQANDTQIQKNFIGNSKLMCWACDVYVTKSNGKRWLNDQEHWRLSGTAKKPQKAWLIPSDFLGQDVITDVRAELRSLIDRLANEFRSDTLRGTWLRYEELSAWDDEDTGE